MTATSGASGAASGAVYPTDARKIGGRAQGAVGANATDGTSPTDTGPFLFTEAVSSVPSDVTQGHFSNVGDLLNGQAAGEARYAANVFYRLYIEDLTVSGRTYEEVDALDADEYARQVTSPGGRYYGDSWSTPPA